VRVPDFRLVKVLICPDSFTGTLSAAQAAEAMAEGWSRVAPGDDLVLRPLSDGGPGFLEAVGAGRGGTHHPMSVTGPLGDPVPGEFLVTDDGTAWIESASAAGLHLVPADQRDPTRTTSRGVGELMGAAVAGGARRIVLGVGGTGTCDGGAGLLAALGATSQPAGALSRGGGALADLTTLDLGPALGAVQGIALEVATDVDVPLLGARGAARGFAPQKGATPEQVEQLEAAMVHWASMLGRAADGRTAAVALGAGAGGGLGAALIRLGARRVPGIGTVLAAADIAGVIDGVDLVVTGEGSFDWQSLRGKVVAGVAAAALVRAVPVLVLAGRVEVSRREWITAGVAAAFPAAAGPGESHHEGVARAAARAARTWSRP
jgi:glycerate kinase